MKRIVMALAVAALFNGTYALAEDAPIVLISSSTYADQHAAELGTGDAIAAFPGAAPGDPIVVKSQSTYADRHAGEAKVAGSAFPGSAREDPIVLESKSTYADKFATERNMQARAPSDPALAE